MNHHITSKRTAHVNSYFKRKDSNELESTKNAEIRKVESLAADRTCQAVF